MWDISASDIHLFFPITSRSKSRVEVEDSEIKEAGGIPWSLLASQRDGSKDTKKTPIFRWSTI